jgi:hypothetical protein
MRNTCGTAAMTALQDKNGEYYPSARIFFREYDNKDWTFDKDTYKRNCLLVTSGPCFDL